MGLMLQAIHAFTASGQGTPVPSEEHLHKGQGQQDQEFYKDLHGFSPYWFSINLRERNFWRLLFGKSLAKG
jgi:hypothetical protein